jgi:hypothetical protein
LAQEKPLLSPFLWRVHCYFTFRTTQHNLEKQPLSKKMVRRPFFQFSIFNFSPSHPRKTRYPPVLPDAHLQLRAAACPAPHC